MAPARPAAPWGRLRGHICQMLTGRWQAEVETGAAAASRPEAKSAAYEEHAAAGSKREASEEAERSDAHPGACDLLAALAPGVASVGSESTAASAKAAPCWSASPCSAEGPAWDAPPWADGDSAEAAAEVLRSVDLRGPLFFYEPAAAPGEERVLRRAARAELLADASVRVAAERSGRGAAGGACAEAAALLVDVRLAREDEPRLLPLLGARVCGGVVGRLLPGARSGPAAAGEGGGAAGDLLCEVLATGAGTAAAHVQRPAAELTLKDAVEQMLLLESRRQDEALLRYQRRLCGQLMAGQRRRYLGLPPP